MTCQHTKHICATWNGFCVCFLHRINTLSRICALHNAKICFCNIRWSSSNMNGALKDVSQKHNTDFLSKWTLPFALLHLHVMRVWYFRVTQYFSDICRISFKKRNLQLWCFSIHRHLCRRCILPWLSKQALGLSNTPENMIYKIHFSWCVMYVLAWQLTPS